MCNSFNAISIWALVSTAAFFKMATQQEYVYQVNNINCPFIGSTCGWHSKGGSSGMKWTLSNSETDPDVSTNGFGGSFLVLRSIDGMTKTDILWSPNFTVTSSFADLSLKVFCGRGTILDISYAIYSRESQRFLRTMYVDEAKCLIPDYWNNEKFQLSFQDYTDEYYVILLDGTVQYRPLAIRNVRLKLSYEDTTNLASDHTLYTEVSGSDTTSTDDYEVTDETVSNGFTAETVMTISSSIIDSTENDRAVSDRTWDESSLKVISSRKYSSTELASTGEATSTSNSSSNTESLQSTQVSIIETTHDIPGASKTATNVTTKAAEFVTASPFIAIIGKTTDVWAIALYIGISIFTTCVVISTVLYITARLAKKQNTWTVRQSCVEDAIYENAGFETIGMRDLTNARHRETLYM